jgi:hypothetical protein
VHGRCHALLSMLYWGTPSAEPHGEDLEVFKRWQKEGEDILGGIHGLGGFEDFGYGQQTNRPQEEKSEMVGNSTRDPDETAEGEKDE